MRIIEKKVQSDFNLFQFGDVHTGSIMSHSEGWEMLVDMMCSPYDGLPATRNYGVDHGDMIEGITVDDPRFDGTTTQGNVLHEKDVAVEMRKQIKDRLIVALDGNHPRKLWRWSGVAGRGLSQIICEDAGIEYGTWSCIIVYKDSKDRLMFKQYATHGKKMISSTADDPKRRITNMELILKRHLKFKMGDCALMTKGHTHKLLCCRPASELYMVDDGGTLKQRYTESNHTDEYIHPDHRWYLNTGSFYKLYGDGFSGYAEIAEYDPLELGFWVVKVRDRKIHDVDKVVLKKTTAEIIEPAEVDDENI